MKTVLLAAGAAAVAISAGAALAAPKHSATAMGPKQPIPYSQLSAYLKASPKQRASKDWWSAQADTGVAANTSATVSACSDVRSTPDATPSASSDNATGVNPATSLPATPPVDAGASAAGQVNPPVTTPK